MFHVTSTALHLFGLTIHWYGLIIAIGIVLAVILAAIREKRLGLPRETTLDLALICIPAAVIAARLYYVIFAWDSYADNPVRALYIWEGGMAIYGGIIGGILAGALYARHKKISVFRLMDLAAPSLALGQAIGRWGNFVNQEAYGGIAAYPWQQVFPISVFIQADQQWHYATFFYESAWCFIIVILLLTAERKGLFHRAGDIFFTYALFYALERALVEGLRTDSLYWGTVRVSQALSLAALVICAAVLLVRGGYRPWGWAMAACCLGMTILVLLGHPSLALIPATLTPVCTAAMYITEKTTDKAMVK